MKGRSVFGRFRERALVTLRTNGAGPFRISIVWQGRRCVRAFVVRLIAATAARGAEGPLWPTSVGPAGLFVARLGRLTAVCALGLRMRLR
jgi:hypothetical protein